MSSKRRRCVLVISLLDLLASITVGRFIKKIPAVLMMLLLMLKLVTS